MTLHDRRLQPGRFRASAALLIAALGSCALPVHGQQELPVVRYIGPEVAAPGDLTRVRVSYTLPSGFWLRRGSPRVRVTDRQGNTVELLPVIMGPPSSQGSGERDLTSGSYAPGSYLVRAELEYAGQNGETGTSVSPWSTLTVPPPARGERPTVRHSVPTVASPGGWTHVSLEFTLPLGSQLLRHPYVLVVDSLNDWATYMPAYIDQQSPDGKGHQDLNTKDFPPASYRVRAEIYYQGPDGQSAAAVSPWTTLTVPAPNKAGLPSVRHSAPPVAPREGQTEVSVQFTLPPGFQLVGTPGLQVNRAEGWSADSQSTTLTQAPPEGAARGELPTAGYLPASYRLRAWLSYTDPEGHFGTVYSDWSTLTVPPPVVRDLRLSPATVAAGRSAWAAIHLTGRPPLEGATISVSSSNPAVAVVPASVSTLTDTASFEVVTRPVTETTTVILSASYGGETRTATLTLIVPVRGLAMYRQGVWYLRDEGTGETSEISFGTAGSLPVPARYAWWLDYAQLGIFDPPARRWLIRDEVNGTQEYRWGEPGDRPVPGDYLGLGGAQLAVFRPSRHQWRVRQPDTKEAIVTFGQATDEPVPADYTGRARLQMALFRPGTADWFVRGASGVWTRARWGARGDRPVPGDYLGLGRAQIAVYRPSTGQWIIRDARGRSVLVSFGKAGDQPVPADYLGLGHVQVAVFRPSTLEWLIRRDDGSTLTIAWGATDAQPVIADPPIRLRSP
jgi:hypothetical protein